jgi:hypothetical protein
VGFDFGGSNVVAPPLNSPCDAWTARDFRFQSAGGPYPPRPAMRSGALGERKQLFGPKTEDGSESCLNSPKRSRTCAR